MSRPSAALALVAVLATANAAQAQTRASQTPAPKRQGGESCFYVTQIQSNHALGDRSVIFRVNVNDFYRLDFAERCPALAYPDPRLILQPFGSELICRAIDLDIKVSEQGPGAIPEPCIPSELHKMTAAEVAAVPKKDLP